MTTAFVAKSATRYGCRPSNSNQTLWCSALSFVAQPSRIPAYVIIGRVTETANFRQRLRFNKPPMKNHVSSLFLAMALIFVNSACQPAKSDMNNLSSFNGQPVSHFMKQYALSLEDASLSDEPPGKLRKITFQINKAFPGKNVSVFLIYSQKLFSRERQWTPTVVTNAIIESIQLTAKDE
jgi:hypothetical protein